MVCVLGVLLAIAIPNFLQARVETHKNLCINNLRMIEAAKEQWALTDRKTEGEPVIEDEVNAFLKTGPPQCPAGGDYTYGDVGAMPRCSLGTTHGHVLTAPDQQEGGEDQEEDQEEEGGKGRGRGGEKGRGKGKGRK